MKKPDKILACPRCTSSDTKFCYFNNYNVNQPRHFCRQCQRYWTAGGAIRNVPVGAGRRQRKDKNSASQNKHCHELKFNGTVLSFGAADTLTDTWSSFTYSSILGKHTRDGEEKCLWIPKNIKDWWVWMNNIVREGNLFNEFNTKSLIYAKLASLFHYP